MEDKKKINLNGNGHKPKKGGKQPGAGRPKGAVGPKARTLQEVKNRIASKADDIVNAELVEALGSNVILKLNKTTEKYEQVTDPSEIVAVINEHKGASGEVEGEFYIVTAQHGNYKSRQYLLDRAFGRPSQAVQVQDAPANVSAVAQKVVERLVREKGWSEPEAQAAAAKLYDIPDIQSDAIN